MAIAHPVERETRERAVGRRRRFDGKIGALENLATGFAEQGLDSGFRDELVVYKPFDYEAIKALVGKLLSVRTRADAGSARATATEVPSPTTRMRPPKTRSSARDFPSSASSPAATAP